MGPFYSSKQFKLLAQMIVLCYFAQTQEGLQGCRRSHNPQYISYSRGGL
jgi:hypothetical protein